jgi:hypothetical protein
MSAQNAEQKAEQAQNWLEIDDDELDEVSGGVLPEFRGRGIQPDGGQPGSHF